MFVLPNKVVIQALEPLQHHLMEYISEHSELQIDASKVEKIDTSGMQLLCSLQKSLMLVEKKIEWHSVSDVLYQTADVLGIVPFLELKQG